MHPYPEDMAEEELSDIIDTVKALCLGREAEGPAAAARLASLGPRGVRPLAHAIEDALWHDVPDRILYPLSERLTEVIAGWGEEAVPHLEAILLDGGWNPYIYDWAQETIFEVLGLGRDERWHACLHLELGQSREGGVPWRCDYCRREFDDDGLRELQRRWER